MSDPIVRTIPESQADRADRAAREAMDRYTEIAQLAGGLAHEIRNPLSTIRLNLDLLTEDFAEPETPREQRILKKLERIRNESFRLENILESFLRFLRVKDLHLERADLSAIVEDVRDFLEPLAVSNGVVIRTQYAADLPPVPLDVELFRQHVLYNLMRNAQLSMPDGGELILITRREGDHAALDVIDTGQGIAPEHISRIFDPFYSTRPGGTGLGLAMVRRVLETHGGSISVESEPGKGLALHGPLTDRRFFRARKTHRHGTADPRPGRRR